MTVKKNLVISDKMPKSTWNFWKIKAANKCMLCCKDLLEETTFLCDVCKNRMKKYNQRRDAHHKQHGLCKRCGKTIEEGSTRVNCEMCISKMRPLDHQRYYKNKNMGTCRCGTPTKDGRVWCGKCSKNNSRRNSKVYYENKSKKICRCGESILDGFTSCEKCRKKLIPHRKKMKNNFRENGLCVRCGKTPMRYKVFPRQTLCEKCYLQQCSYNNLGSTKHWKFLKEKLVAQGCKCTYTGDKIVLGENDSLDHINPVARFPKLKHDLNNVEWITREVNFMKSENTKDEFIQCLRTIRDFTKNETRVHR
jgi:hypothetical protein